MDKTKSVKYPPEKILDSRISLAKKLGLENQITHNKITDSWIKFDSKGELLEHLVSEHGFPLKKYNFLYNAKNDFEEHIHSLSSYPARLPYGALLKIEEILGAGFEKPHIYVIDENIKVQKCDPFLVVDKTSTLQHYWINDQTCYLVYGWKDKKDDTV